MIHGIICIDKPGDHTSFDVIARVRGIVHQKKVGHGGTLDPMATGVLPVFLGHATKCCDILPDQRKRYIAQVWLGLETDTQDRTGRVIRRTQTRITRAMLEQALTDFEGGYDQMPPMYSAVQVDGKRLYDLARQGMEVERTPRHVYIYAMRLLEFNEEAQHFMLDVECSKGTYIRTLCSDIAQHAGTLAVLSGLRRTYSAGFELKDCITLETLTQRAENGTLQQVLLPIERAFITLPRVYLSPRQVTLLKNGVKMELQRVKSRTKQGAVAVYGDEGNFLATAQIDEEQGIFTHVKLFCDRG